MDMQVIFLFEYSDTYSVHCTLYSDQYSVHTP